MRYNCGFAARKCGTTAGFTYKNYCKCQQKRRNSRKSLKNPSSAAQGGNEYIQKIYIFDIPGAVDIRAEI